MHQHVEVEDIDPRFLTILLTHRHIQVSQSQTKCGIDFNTIPRIAEVPLGCDCGDPDCEFPPTCPICLGKVH